MSVVITSTVVAASARFSKPRKKSIREITPIYWRRLIEVGVPINAAQAIAWTIAKYDAGKLPEANEQALLRQYCRFICRAELWRANLLLSN
jgi:hypothetical protein